MLERGRRALTATRRQLPRSCRRRMTQTRAWRSSTRPGGRRAATPWTPAACTVQAWSALCRCVPQPLLVRLLHTGCAPAGAHAATQRGEGLRQGPAVHGRQHALAALRLGLPWHGQARLCFPPVLLTLLRVSACAWWLSPAGHTPLCHNVVLSAHASLHICPLRPPVGACGQGACGTWVHCARCTFFPSLWEIRGAPRVAAQVCGGGDERRACQGAADAAGRLCGRPGAAAGARARHDLPRPPARAGGGPLTHSAVQGQFLQSAAPARKRPLPLHFVLGPRPPRRAGGGTNLCSAIWLCCHSIAVQLPADNVSTGYYMQMVLAPDEVGVRCLPGVRCLLLPV